MEKRQKADSELKTELIVGACAVIGILIVFVTCIVHNNYGPNFSDLPVLARGLIVAGFALAGTPFVIVYGICASIDEYKWCKKMNEEGGCGF